MVQLNRKPARPLPGHVSFASAFPELANARRDDLYCKAREIDMPRGSLGDFEQLVLLAILRLKDDTYGLRIREEIEDRARRTASLGTVYTALALKESLSATKRMAAGVEALGGGLR